MRLVRTFYFHNVQTGNMSTANPIYDVNWQLGNCPCFGATSSTEVICWRCKRNSVQVKSGTSIGQIFRGEESHSSRRAIMTVSNPTDRHYDRGVLRLQMWISRNDEQCTKQTEASLVSLITDQDLALIISLIVLIFVGWGIYPLLPR
jgi:hypothetical protein